MKPIHDVYRDFINDPRTLTNLTAMGFSHVCEQKQQGFTTMEFVPGQGLVEVTSFDYGSRYKALTSMLLTLIQTEYPEFLVSPEDLKSDSSNRSG